MLFPKKVKYRKAFTKRMNPKRQASMVESRGVDLSFGSYGIKATEYARVTSNQIEAARKVISRHASKSGKVWIRIFPDRPFTQKPAEVKMGKGKGDLQGYYAEVKAGRIMFEVDGVEGPQAVKALTMASAKLPVKTKVVSRTLFA